MHDPTEGGVATGIHELASASGTGAFVHADRIPIEPSTRRICTVLGVDPLGLIASGSLLIAAAPEAGAAVLGALHDAGISAAEIGVLTEPSEGVALRGPDGEAPLPRYDLDEAARVLAGG
jgi:hydrogenase maturation factor